MTVQVTLRSSQGMPLSEAQVDGNFTALANGVNSNSDGVVAANQSIASQNTTIGNLGNQISQIAAQQVSPTEQIFTDGIDYVSGTSNTLTTTIDYQTVANLRVFFGGVRQFQDQIQSYVNKVITFVSVIPLGTAQCAVDGGLAQVIGVPSAGSVGVGQLAPDTLAYFDKSSSALSAWAYVQAWQFASVVRDSNEAISSASIVWPDGATGTFTTDVASSLFPGAIDAWHATHVLNSVTKTFTQPTVTRDFAGAVIGQPSITVV